MRHTLIHSIAIIAAAAMLLAACSDESDGFEPGAPIPSADTRSPDTNTTAPADTTPATQPTTTPDTNSTTEPSPTTSEPAATTEPAPSTTEQPPVTTADPELADTPQAPGFDFPPADLQTDPDSPNNNRNIRPEDQPILDAYHKASLAEQITFSRWPLDPRSPELQAAPFTANFYERYASSTANRTDKNHVLDISGGLTSRPYVIEDDDGDPNRAIVWDCIIDATFWRDVDTGEKAPPDFYPNAGPPGVEVGLSTVLVRVEDEWLVDDGGEEPRACA